MNQRWKYAIALQATHANDNIIFANTQYKLLILPVWLTYTKPTQLFTNQPDSHD